MKPSDSIHPQLYFSAHGYELAVALMDIENPDWPGIVYPALFKKVGIGQWFKIDERQPIWNDQQESFTPENMAKLIVDDFNITIETLRFVEEKNVDSAIGRSYFKSLPLRCGSACKKAVKISHLLRV